MKIITKRITGVGILLLLLMIALPLTAWAAESGELTLSTEIIGQSDAVKDGKAKINVPDGGTVGISGALPDDLLAVVHFIDKKNQPLHDDILKPVEGKGTNPSIFDMTLVKDDGNPYTATTFMNISITPAVKYTNPVVYYVDKNGSATEMPSTVAGNTITYETDHNSIYVVLEKPPVAAGTTAAATAAASVKTGLQSTGIPILPMALLAVAGLAVALWVGAARHRSH